MVVLWILTQGPGFLLSAQNRWCMSRWSLTSAMSILPCRVASVCLYLHWKYMTCNIICTFAFCVLAANSWLWIICDTFCILVGDFSTLWHQFFLLLSKCATVCCTVGSITPFSVTLFLNIVWLFHSLVLFPCTDNASQIFSFSKYL